MEKFYGSKNDAVLRMLVPIYGTKQAAECLYKEIVKRSKKKGYGRSNADFTLFFAWTEKGRLLVFAVWVDDILAFGGNADLDVPTKYRSLTALIMYIMQWSRPDVNQAGRSLARYMHHTPNESHWKALQYCLAYIMGTKNRGLVIKPTCVWNGSKDFKFVIRGRYHSNYAADVNDRLIVTGCRTFVEDSPVCQRSATQRHMTLSVTEAEGAAGITETQDMLYVANVLESLGLKGEYPMILEMDNKGAVDLANSWSVGGRTCHVDVRMYFLRELKDQGKLVIRHVSGDDNDTDNFTKNTSAAVFNKHVVNIIGNDEYVQDGEEVDVQTPK